ncbi:hypothetical protein HDU91_000256, partial [Kappamyces sp. JEL0680]
MDEVFDFLSHARLDVRNEAVKITVGLTGDVQYFEHFKARDFRAVYALMELCKDETLTAHDALSSLINLSKDIAFVGVMTESPFLHELVLLLMLPTNVNADLCCMLLNNLSQHAAVVNRLLPLENASKNEGVEIIDNLLDLFVKGDASLYNKSATFDFLAGVFANITTSPQGCQFFLHPSTLDGLKRITKLMVFTEHPSVIRRGGCVSAIKNICYSANLSSKGVDILIDPSLNLLVYILLPLSGPEDYTDEEMEHMPDELQLLEPEKKRERDTAIRTMLLEALLALGSTRPGREFMRANAVYHVVKKLHVQEKSDDVIDHIENLVNLLM